MKTNGLIMDLVAIATITFNWLQGLTLDGGVLVVLRRAGGLEDEDWLLAMYVMLTRARKLQSLILLGFTEQVEMLLRGGPPY